MAEISVTGDRELDRKLKTLRDSVEKKIKKAAVKSALGIAVKAIKREVPSRFKSVRKSMGVRVGSNKNYILLAKVGWRIGPGARKAIKNEAAISRAQGTGKGISGQNFHWWILGAGYKSGGRFHESGKSTGVMKDQDKDIIPRGWAASESKVVTKLAERLKIGIEREAAKQ